MIDLIKKAVNSRTVWTLVAIAVFNGLQSISPMVSGQVSVYLNIALGLLGAYFKLNPSQSY